MIQTIGVSIHIKDIGSECKETVSTPVSAFFVREADDLVIIVDGFDFICFNIDYSRIVRRYVLHGLDGRTFYFTDDYIAQLMKS